MTDDPSLRSYTMWERLEPITRSADLTDALRAAIADPLWLLSRQEQLGELAGEDAGSPVRADLDYRHDRFNRLRTGAGSATRYDPTTDPPLATLVEREPVAVGEETDPDGRTQVETGRHFLERYRDELTARVGDSTDLPTPSSFPDAFLVDFEDEDLDGAGRRYAAVVTDRTLDGVAIYRSLVRAEGILEASAPSDVEWGSWEASESWLPTPADRAVDEAFQNAALGFVEWYRDLYAEPDIDELGGSEQAWDGDRLRYEATVSAGDPANETVFEIDDHQGDRLDWDAFSASTDSLSPAADATTRDSETRLPTRARFEGMPAPRFWELEDANVDLSSVTAAGEDLSRLLVLEYALTAGTDWFTLPLQAPVGSVTRIPNLSVTDTFGVTESVDSAAEQSDGPDWHGFGFDLPDHDHPGLLLPPLVGSTNDSGPIEEVQFTRDEVANLVFGLERRIEGPLGKVRDRTEFRPPELELIDISPDADADAEYIALRNAGDDTLDITGWELRADGTTIHTFGTATEGVRLPSNGTLTVFTGGQAAFDTDTIRHLERSDSIWVPDTELAVYRPELEDDGSRSFHLAIRESVEGQTAPDVDQAYRLATDVPDYWIPLKTDPTGPESYRLRPAILLDESTLDTPDEALPVPQGRILTPSLRIYDDVIPRTGRTVTRRYRHTPWTDGRTYVWSGRQVSFGRGEESSGLRFDFTEPPVEASPVGGQRAPTLSEPITGTGATATQPTSEQPVSVVNYQVDARSPDIDSPRDEFVTLENTGTAYLDLTGWSLMNEAGHRFDFPEEFSLRPGERVNIRTGRGTDTHTDLYWGLDSYRWNRNVDTIVVTDETDSTVVEQPYPDLSGVPESTPLSITEMAFNVEESAPDGLTDEYVEFTNTGSESLRLEGWVVRDLAEHTYTFPQETTLEAGASIRLRTGEGTDTNSDLYWGSRRPIWNDDGNVVFVYDRDGVLVTAEAYHG